jgi:23S rRNA pseudouridine2604 synthase
MTDPKTTRINKYLSEAGYCSRREADRLIAEHRVTINGQVPAVGTKVELGDDVRVDGRSIHESTGPRVYLAFHKPVGIVCTTDTEGEPDNIIDYIGYPERIFPIGRLDKMSEGLIFLTNDGDIVNKILRARNKHEKQYRVKLNYPITPQFLEQMAAGVAILDTVTRPCRVRQISEKSFEMVLTQGLNRQIRRMCEALDYRVARLQRVRIMNVRLDIPPGQWRDLTSGELTEINRMTQESVGTWEGDPAQ